MRGCALARGVFPVLHRPGSFGIGHAGGAALAIGSPTGSRPTQGPGQSVGSPVRIRPYREDLVPEVGLVPHFEERLRYLGDSVTVDPVADQLVDERGPGIVVRGWGDVPAIVEDDLVT
jgi:hypothetical protein